MIENMEDRIMYEEVIEKINTADYEDAYKLIVDIKKKSSNYDGELAILEAETCYQMEYRQEMFHAIGKGIQIEPENYELFFLLGNYYMDVNLQQAYLCYEQAEFYCENHEDLDIILEQKNKLVQQGVNIPELSIVILSYNACREMKLCLESLKKTVPVSNQIIVIDNASTNQDDGEGVVEYLQQQDNILLICNKQNVGFPAGCNQGIKLAEPYNDILLLNNDTIVFPNSIFWLRMGLYENCKVGATGSMSSRIGNYQQIQEQFGSLEEYEQYARKVNIPMDSPYESRIRLAGFAMMLKRQALDMVGLLDERFSPGNYEDDDLSLRLLLNDYKLLVCKNSFIFHFSAKSFGKNLDNYYRILTENEKVFRQKWKIDINYYSQIRMELQPFLRKNEQQINILEVGCGMGATLGYLRDTLAPCNVYGVELNSMAASYAKHYIPNIIQGNIETMDLNCYEENMFDYILLPDVLEHLHDPEAVLNKLKKYLKPSGFIVASIPNIMHYSVMLELLKGNFTYEDSGILDRTHIHFFTLQEIFKMFMCCGFEIVETQGKHLDIVLSETDEEIYRQLMQIPGVASEINFQVYQYMVKARIK